MFPRYATWLVIGLGMLFGLLNGIQDSGSLTAAVICSGAVGPRKALLLAAAAQLAGALLVGVAVARTIGQGIVVGGLVTPLVVLAALLGALTWNLLAWSLGLPASASHALIGALVGAAWVQSGPQAIALSGLRTVLLALLLSPWIGFVASYLLMKLLILLLQGATPRVGSRLQKMQWLLAPALAFGHGANDAQKVMGIVALGLVALGALPSFSIPLWLQLAAALSLATGTSLGGWRVLRTLGLRLYRIRPIHGFASQAAAALVIVASSAAGAAVSTTQVIGASIAGAGSAQRLSQVRWGVIGNIVAAWLLTVPAAGALAALLVWTLRPLVG